jgi:hypothetical protein
VVLPKIYTNCCDFVGDGLVTYSELFTKWSINTQQVTAGTTISNLVPYGYDYEVLVYEKQRRITYKGIHKFNGGDIELGCYSTQFGAVDNSYVLLRDDAVLYISESVAGNITFAIRQIAD